METPATTPIQTFNKKFNKNFMDNLEGDNLKSITFKKEFLNFKSLIDFFSCLLISQTTTFRLVLTLLLHIFLPHCPLPKWGMSLGDIQLLESG